MSGIMLFDCYEAAGHEDVDALYVLHTDHLASHAFDEEVERAAFEVWFSDHARRVLKWDESDIESEFQLDDDGEYVYDGAMSAFDGWRAACQSRAKRAEGAE